MMMMMLVRSVLLKANESFRVRQIRELQLKVSSPFFAAMSLPRRDREWLLNFALSAILQAKNVKLFRQTSEAEEEAAT